jgi:hypothetical protein
VDLCLPLEAHAPSQCILQIKDVIAGREGENQYDSWRTMMNLVLGDWEAVADSRKVELVSKGESNSVQKDLPLDALVI